MTQANVDDRQPLKDGNIPKNVFGSLYTDRGYISKELVAMLFDDGRHLVTDIRSYMKNILMTLRDKILLRKNSVIENIITSSKIYVTRNTRGTEVLAIL